MLLSHLPNRVDQSAPTIGNCISTPGHVTPSVSTIVTQHHCAEENSTSHLHMHWPLAATNMEPKDTYPQDHICEVIKDTSERDNLWHMLNFGRDPSGLDFAIPSNKSMSLYFPVLGEPTVGKCTFDLSVELSLTSTGSENDGSPMTLPSRDLFPTNGNVLSSFRMIAPDPYKKDDCCQCLLTHGITFPRASPCPMASPCIGDGIISTPGMTLTTNGNFQDHHDYHELLCS